ncbi:NADH dehydrogenase [ubiquinone] 1 beta subcomplex subunit 9 [Orussus abietinus]|uniref:NADH dehydrogenase [ubiquinone] 1 beta subcomplex subunit 9 n=1 Tax=Orussus abietinus TaxID=222816 RepID=UPI000626BE15|nr:NADH dehydrogenase [ubiquinone] 1 beta subcomplex subunit 9 [Orussus abietinus]
MAQIPIGIRSHSQKVCSLYKRAVRMLRCHFPIRHDFRYHAVLLRDRFDKSANIKDIRVAKDMLISGEEELFKYQHYLPIQFPNSPGGIAYDREVILPDWILDYWHPIEKAMYPKYFALREKRKKEYIEFFDKQYPDAPKHFDDDH